MSAGATPTDMTPSGGQPASGGPSPVAGTPSPGGTRLVVRNVLANYTGTIIILIVAFFLTPFLVSRLGRDLFGLWALIGGVMAYGSMLDLGMDSAVVKYVGEHTDLEDVPCVERVVHTALAVYLGIGLAVLVFTAAAAAVFPLLFPLPPELVGTSRTLVIIAGTSLALNFPLGMYNGVLHGLQHQHIVMIADIVWGVSTALGAVIVIASGGGVIGLALVYLAGNTLGQGIRIGYLLVRHPHVRWLRIRLDAQQGRTLFNFSFWSFLLRLASTLRLKTDEIVIGASLSVGAVTPYYVGMRLSEMLDRLTSQLSTALFPFGSRLDALHNRERLRTLFVSASRWNLAIAAPMALFLGLQAPRFLEAWMGQGYSKSAVVAQLLIVATMCSVYVSVGYTFLKSLGRHQLVARWAVIEALTNLALSLILVRVWGMTGVAVGTAIPALLYNFGIVLPQASRHLQVPMVHVLRASMVVQFPAVALTGLVIVLGGMIPGDTTLARLLLEAAVAGAVYWTTYYVSGADQEEKRLVRSIASGLRARM